MGGSDAYDRIKASLLKADMTGKGCISKDVLLKILERIADPAMPSSDLEQFLNTTFSRDSVPISVFLDFVFQRFPGLVGAEDVDLSAVFQCIDKNGNGFLEKEEVVAAASAADSNLLELCQQIPCLQTFLSVDKWEKAFWDMDTNADGKISWFEFLRFFAQSGSYGGPSTEEGDLIAVFTCIDKNRNGVLDKSEVLAAVNSENSGVKEFCEQIPALLPLLQKDSWQAAFEALDTNADGMISWYEFSAFFANVCVLKSPPDRV